MYSNITRKCVQNKYSCRISCPLHSLVADKLFMKLAQSKSYCLVDTFFLFSGCKQNMKIPVKDSSEDKAKLISTKKEKR